MFSDVGSKLATENQPLWYCFLGRFNDIAPGKFPMKILTSLSPPFRTHPDVEWWQNTAQNMISLADRRGSISKVSDFVGSDQTCSDSPLELFLLPLSQIVNSLLIELHFHPSFSRTYYLHPILPSLSAQPAGLDTRNFRASQGTDDTVFLGITQLLQYLVWIW